MEGAFENSDGWLTLENYDVVLIDNSLRPAYHRLYKPMKFSRNQLIGTALIAIVILLFSLARFFLD